MNTRNCSILTKRYKSAASTIHVVYRLINSTYDLKMLLSRLSRLINSTFQADSCCIILLEPNKEKPLMRCAVKTNSKSAITRGGSLVSNIEKQIIKKSSGFLNHQSLAIPLIAEDLIGMVILKRSKDKKPFDHFDQEILTTMGEQAVIGIRNLQLYEEQHKIILGSIKSLVKLFDTRVPSIYTHSPYFSRLASSIGEEMHLSEKDLQSLKFASLLHDAGKADIPLEILTKSTKLTNRELNIIQEHPFKGASILKHLEALRPAIPIILHHHEKYNGTGYPSGLKKGKIPLGARIMSVADAFEAMVYGRPYRERITIENAVKEIKSKSGTQFDPVVVEAFLRAIKKLNLKKYLEK